MVAEFIESIKGKNVVVWGLGLSRGGVESAKFFAENGAKVKVIDLKKEEELSPSIRELRGYPNLVLSLGGQKEEDFLGKTDKLIVQQLQGKAS